MGINFSDEQTTQYADRLRSLIQTGFAEYYELFGGLPKDVHGRPYANLTINVEPGFGGEAHSERLDISIGDFKLFNFYNWEMIVLHEMFHLWSAETFRYADGKEQWFNKGVAEYYTLKTAAKIGLSSKDQIIPAFTAPLGYYLSANGLGMLSMRKAGSTDSLKRDHYFLVYHGGYTAALYMDFQIRHDTNGEKSLDDLMRHLYENYSLEKPYAMKSLISSLRASTSQDFSKFFRMYVKGKGTIPIGHRIHFGDLYFKTISQSEDFSSDEVILLRILGM